MTTGFVGVGTMGRAMAERLIAAGVALTVWNRTPARCASLVALGAHHARSVDALFAGCATVLVALLDEAAVDATLGRGGPAFQARIAGRTLVMLGTTSTAYSTALADDVRACGGRYVEAPVSGSRGPAAEGALVGMLAGEPEDVERIEALIRPLCRQIVHCGTVPQAMRLKLAVNHYLIALVAALAEADRAARASGVDPQLFRAVVEAGPMASPVSNAKLDMLARAEFTAQASIRDVARIAALVAQQARDAGCRAPLADACALAFADAVDRGLGEQDMIAVLQPASVATAPPT